MAVTTAAEPPPVRSEPARRARLRTMKRRATALLAVTSGVFLAVTVWGGDTGWAAYLQATAEAAMIGGVADWFAVTALFRHPLGLPIPHTAIVAARKDSFAETLGEFIQDTFLTPEAVVARLRSASVVDRVAAWVSDPANAARVADEILDAAVTVADLMRDEDVHALIESSIRERIEATQVAPLAGRALEAALRGGHHRDVLDAAVRELDGYLDTHRTELRERFGRSSPWWLPGAAEDRIVERIVDGARAFLAEMLADPEHPTRREIDERLAQLAADLKTSPQLAERGENLKQQVLARPELRAWAASLWDDAKSALRSQAAEPGSPLRGRLAAAVVATGVRVRDDPVLVERVDRAIEEAATYVIGRFHGEIVTLVRDTISRWDAEETSDRLELLLGPDLQFIRINGTVVGAAIGLALHTVADVLA